MDDGNASDMLFIDFIGPTVRRQRVVRLNAAWYHKVVNAIQAKKAENANNRR
jgi:hypothetical protein